MGLKDNTEESISLLMIHHKIREVAERFVNLRSIIARLYGDIENDNAGMSNDKLFENKSRRKSKVSRANVRHPWVRRSLSFHGDSHERWASFFWVTIKKSN